MNIAYLGWGSLIWKLGDLKIAGPWETDGPCLPIEFARISSYETLTLVLHPGVPDLQVLWAKSAATDVETAVGHLRKRERTIIKNIGYVSISSGNKRCNVILDLWQRIELWAKQKDLEAVVWTDIPSNFKEKTGMDLTGENTVAYLSALPASVLEKAEQYVRMAPVQLDTDVSKKLKEALGWASYEEYKAGFWLDKNTFIKPDKVKIQTVARKKMGDRLGKSESAQMLIMNDAVEMTVDDRGKILGVDKHPGLGLWLETVNKAMKNQKTASPKLVKT